MRNYENPSGKSLVRIAQLKKSEELVKASSEKEEFRKGHKEGKLRLAIAHKFMPLTSRGLNTYTEGDLNVVWVRDGDSICRVDHDLSWVDQILNSKEEKNENR